MLKIKDNVDLKELLKFGFNFNNSNGKYEYRTNERKVLDIIVRTWDRKIYLFGNIDYAADEDILFKLYSLIKADLVEMTEDE